MKYGLIFFIVMLFSLPASAEEFREKINLPKIETQQINGEDFKCLNTKQWQRVLLITNEYHGLYKWRLKTVDTLKLYELQIRGYETTIHHYESIMDIQANEVDYLENRIDDLIEESGNVSLVSQIKEYVLYAVVLGELAAILGLVWK